MLVNRFHSLLQQWPSLTSPWMTWLVSLAEHLPAHSLMSNLSIITLLNARKRVSYCILRGHAYRVYYNSRHRPYMCHIRICGRLVGKQDGLYGCITACHAYIYPTYRKVNPPLFSSKFLYRYRTFLFVYKLNMYYKPTCSAMCHIFHAVYHYAKALLSRKDGWAYNTTWVYIT